MLKIEHLTEEIPVYDITVEDTHNFYANDILVHNCTEILIPTTPIQSLDDENGRIALCILSALNVGKIKSDEEIEELCELTVRALDELIDYQEYPVKAAELSAKGLRTLGVGIIGLAHYFAKLGVKYEDRGAADAAHSLAESIQYFLLKASNKLAKEKGVCDGYNCTTYSEGILPIDTYKKEVDEICSVPLRHDWEELRRNILEHGLRHCTHSCVMPSESCLFWEHKIKTSTGEMDFHQIAEYGGLDWRGIEENDAIGWYDLNKTITVETQDGYKEVDKLYFNGNKEVATITFENGKVIKCTPNHKFLVRLENGSTIWKRVYELNEDDEVVEI
jgi:ribonucleotide reductase alpha subunit